MLSCVSQQIENLMFNKLTLRFTDCYLEQTACSEYTSPACAIVCFVLYLSYRNNWNSHQCVLSSKSSTI